MGLIILFFTLVFSFYLLFILYPYYRIIKPFHSKILTYIYFLISILAIIFIIIGRWADKNYFYTLAYLSILFGLLWLGFSLYLFFSTLFIELYKTLVKLIKKFLKINFLPNPSPKETLILVLFLTVILSIYSYYETLNLQIIRIKIYSNKLPKEIGSLKIMHISDLHLGPIMGKDKVRLIRKIWEREKPDLIVDTGDLVDGNLKGKIFLAEELSTMVAPYGKFLVLGNHEYYRGYKQAIEFIERAGYKILRNERVDLGIMEIVGINDTACKIAKVCKEEERELELLKKLNRKKFILLLKHQPKIDPKTWGYFDLMLSGHTHGGIYTPLGRFLKFWYITDRGLVRRRDSYIFVSKGIGTGGPPMRFLTPPDIAIIEIFPTSTFKSP